MDLELSQDDLVNLPNEVIAQLRGNTASRKPPEKRISKKVVGVVVDGATEWHIPGCGGPDYATLCGLDGNDPGVGQTGVVQALTGAKIDCDECKRIWMGLSELRLRMRDFI